MSLHDDQPLDTKEERALKASLMLPAPERSAWWDGLPENARRAIMQKLLNAYAKADTPRDIGTLARALMAAERLDIEREKLKVGGGVVNNTQVNNTIDLRGLTVEQLKALAGGTDE